MDVNHMTRSIVNSRDIVVSVLESHYRETWDSSLVSISITFESPLYIYLGMVLPHKVNRNKESIVQSSDHGNLSEPLNSRHTGQSRPERRAKMAKTALG